jgi:hypothetical protein
MRSRFLKVDNPANDAGPSIMGADGPKLVVKGSMLSHTVHLTW